MSELARVFNVFASESVLEAFAINAAMTAPALLLQKPTAKSKSIDQIRQRIALWEHIPELLKQSKDNCKELYHAEMMGKQPRPNADSQS